MDAVRYLDYVNGEMVEKECTDYNTVTDSTTTLTNGWWVVAADTTVSERITCSGDVHLILVNGKRLTASLGIGVNAGNSLTVYAQTSYESDPTGVTMGKITASHNTKFSCIGGSPNAGTIVINGGYIIAINNSTTWGDYGAGAGIGGAAFETIVINNGIISAEGGVGKAGIGGASPQGAITINGGKVTAKGGSAGASIGSVNGVQRVGSITINGGIVIAQKPKLYAGVGSPGIGNGTNFGEIRITGGDVTATGLSYANTDGAAIGGINTSTGGTVIITGGTVKATGAVDIGIPGSSTASIYLSGDTATGYPKITAQTYGGNITLGTTFVAESDPTVALTPSAIKAFSARKTIYPTELPPMIEVIYDNNVITAIPRSSTSVYRKLEAKDKYSKSHLSINVNPASDTEAKLAVEINDKIYSLNEEGTYTLTAGSKYMPYDIQFDYIKEVTE